MKELEKFTLNNKEVDFEILDFWKSKYSNIYNMQEVIAEFIVEKALGIDKAQNTDYWTLYDILYRNYRIEIKESSYYHAWNKEDLKDNFIKYLPKETPEYFYNEIFNLCLIEEDLPMFVINDYINKIKEFIDCKQYDYAFTIYSSIICALCDSKIYVSSTKLIELYSKLGIFARITYRKGNDELKKTINNWIKSFEEKNFYDDVYLEDLLLNIK